MAITTSIIAATANIGTSVYSAQQASKANKQASNAANDQAVAQRKLLDEAKAKSANDTSIANRDAAREKQRRAALAAQGRNDTLLTGPLGASGTPATTGKTILGG